MRKLFLCFFTVAFAITAYTQTNNKIVIGQVDSIYSNILKEQRKIWIYTPTLTSGNYDSTKRYPVLYLLDGDAHFTSVVGLVQQLSQANGNTVLPEMIIVGILNTDRTRDLTPTHIISDAPIMDSNSCKNNRRRRKLCSIYRKRINATY